MTNLAPSLTGVLTPNVTFEGPAPINVFSGTPAVDDGDAGVDQNFIGLTFTVSGLEDGTDEQLLLDGSSISLVNGSGTLATTNFGSINFTVTVSGVTADVVLTLPSLSATQVENLLLTVGYSNTAATPTAGGGRTVLIASLQDDGTGTAPGVDTTSTSFVTNITVGGTGGTGGSGGSGGSGGGSSSSISINEVDLDTSGSPDVSEFIELYDGGSGSTALSNLALVLFDSTGISYSTIDISSGTTGVGGFFTIGGSGVTGADQSFASSDAIQKGTGVVVLVNFTTDPATEFPNGTLLSSLSQSNIADALVYTTDGTDASSLASAIGTILGTSPPVVAGENDNLNAEGQSVAATTDGGDVFIATTPTPGASNGGDSGGSGGDTVGGGGDTVGGGNSAPTITLPSAPTVNVGDTNVAIDDTIDIADVDGIDTQTVTLTITGGAVSIDVGGSGVSVTTGDGTDDSSLVFVGSETQVDAALDSLTFTPASGVSGTGAGQIQIQVDDGAGGNDDETLTFDINGPQTFIVTTLDDETFNNDGNDATDGAGLSLREAIGLANANNSTADTIIFQPGLSGTLTLTDGELAITGDVTISGSNDSNTDAEITIDGNNLSRVLSISGTDTDVTLASLTITGGNVAGDGGAINVAGGNSGGNADADPVEPDESNSVTLVYSTVSGNIASGSGGGLYVGADADAVVFSSTISGNTANDGGGAFASTGADVTFSNATISGNTATAFGGGIRSYDGQVAVLSSTISGNTAGADGGGGIAIGTSGGVSNSFFALSNSIVLGNSGGNTDAGSNDDEIIGSPSTLGTNIVGTIGGDFDANGDGNIDNANLSDVFATVSSGAGVLADNGGPVETIALNPSASNPALDVADIDDSFPSDAAGNTRELDFASIGNDGAKFGDLGAVELQSGPNIAPTLSLSESTLGFTEDAGAVQIDAAGTINDTDGNADWNGGTIVAQVTTGAVSTDQLSISDIDGDATAITISGTDILANGVDIGDVSTSGGTVTGGTALTITFDSDATNANVQEVLQSIRYESATDALTGVLDRTVTITATDAEGASAVDTRAITITEVNDAPTLTATGANPTFTEDGVAQDLFSTVTASTVESDDRISSVTLTVTNVADGADEILSFDGSDVALVDGETVTTATNSLSVSVSVTGSTATVSFSGATLTSAQTQTLVDGLTYRNTSDNPTTAGNRVVTITGITDDGGTANGGVDAATPNITSTVTLSAVNDAPAITADTVGGTQAAGGNAVDLFSNIVITNDDNDAAQLLRTLSIVITGVEDGANEVLDLGGGVTVPLVETPLVLGPDPAVFVSITGNIAVVNFVSVGGLTPAQVQTQIDALGYQNTAANPTAGDRTFEIFSLQDDGGTDGGGVDTAAGSGGTGLGIVSTVAVGANEAPTIDLTAVAEVAVGDGPQSVLGTITVTDSNAGDTQSITVALTGGTGTVNITGTSVSDLAGDGSASITFSGSLADVNTVLDTLQFTPDGSAIGANAGSVTVTTNDGVNSDVMLTGNFNITEAAGLVVTSANDDVDPFDGETTLREAINFANANPLGEGVNEITFDATVFDGTGETGLIRLTGGELSITEAVNITGGASQNIIITGDADDDDVTVMDGGTDTHITDVSASFGAAAGDADDLLDDNSRVFSIIGTSSNVTFTNLTITGGRATGAAEHGGGISSFSPNILTLTDTTVSGNSVTGNNARGGGLYTQSGDIVLTNSTVSGNVSANSSGGGIQAQESNSSVTAINSTISGNTAATNGGGIRTYLGDVTLTSSTVSGNSAFYGGGISAQTGDVTLTNSTVSGNTAAGGYGGGIFSGANGSVTSTNSTISGNTAAGSPSFGGGIFARSGDIELTNTTVSGNAATSGSGINAAYGNITLTNSIILGNDPDGVSQIAGAFTPNANSITSGDATLVFETVVNGAGVLADNGGDVETIALLDDLANPALDVGVAPTGVTTDATGNSRDVDLGSVDNGGTVDAGAVELQILPNQAPTISGLVSDTTVATDAASDLDLSASAFEDIDSTGDIIVTLTASAGTMAASNGGGVEVGDSGTSTITLTGTVDEINTFLNTASNIQYTSANGAAGDNAATLTVTANDGDGSGDVALGTVNIDITEAGSLVVTSANDDVDPFDGETTLREAINFANANPLGEGVNEITFDATVFDGTGDTGLIRLNGTELVITEAVNITGGASQNIIITGDANDDDAVEAGTHITDVSASTDTQLDDNSRVFNITGSTSDVTFTNLTITGGRTTADNASGGGINSAADITLVNGTISGNSATGAYADGGGFFASGTATVTDSNIDGNIAGSEGGGFFSGGGTVTDTNVTNNSARYGGGIDGGGDITITSSTVSGNSATESGGGISVAGNADLISTTVSDNTANLGGGIESNSSNITLTGSTVSGNSTTREGGGIRSEFGTITLTNSTISGNSTDAAGGGIYGAYGSIILINSTISGNSAATSGGGVYGYSGGSGGSITLTNSIVLGNTAAGSDNDEIGLGTNGAPSITANGGNIVGADSTAFEASGVANVDNADPALVFETVSNGAGVLADNGGDVETIALNPSPLNPALDVGTAPAGVTADATGNARDVDVSIDNGGTVDAGAVELQVLPNSAPEITLPTAPAVDAGDTDVAIADDVQIADIDNDDQTVTLTITSGTASLDTTGLTFTTGDGTDDASMVFSGTLAAVNTALDSLTFTPDGAAPGGAAASIQIATDDGNGGTDDETLVFNLREAGSLVVTSANDDVDAFDGETTLREAINFANSQAGTDTITFDGTVFTGGDASLIRLSGTELSITEAVNIDGSAGIDIVITGDANDDDAVEAGTHITDVSASFGGTPGASDDLLDDNSRVFNITGSSSDVTFTNLTITGGRSTGSDQNGGGINSVADVTLVGSAVSGNSTAGNESYGGGIYGGTVTLTNSTVSGNSTTGDSADGGGISSHGAVTLTNSTISGNSTAGYRADGGGVFTYNANVTLTNSTVSGNSVTGDYAAGGGIYINNLGGTYNGTLTLTNSIVLGNSADSEIYSRTIVAVGGNIVGADSTAFDASGDANIDNADPALVFETVSNGAGVLADNGGDVETIALRPFGDNPALDVGTNTAGATDATGATRDVDLTVDNGGSVDAGAVELQVLQNSEPTITLPTAPVLTDADSDVAIADDIEITDVDNDDQTVTLTITGGTASLDTIGLTFTTGDGTDDASMVFSGTLTDVNTALDSLTFTPGAGVSGVDAGSIQIQTDDGNGGTADESLTFDIAPTLTVTTNLDTGDDATTASTLAADTADGDGLSLREALHHALSGSVINFDGTVFTGGADSLIRLTDTLSFDGKTLTIDGTDGTDVVISGDVDGDDTTFSGTSITDLANTADTALDDNVQVFNVRPDSGDETVAGNLSLSNLTITGGSSTRGGGIDIEGGSISLTNTTIRGNQATGDGAEGGGIYVRNGNETTITNSTIADNRAIGSSASGGGLNVTIGDATITASTFANNSAGGGGGGASVSGTATITNSTFVGNTAQSGGGGVSNGIGLTITNSTFTGNSGGAIEAGSTVTLTNSIILGNTPQNSDVEISGGGTVTGVGTNIVGTDSTAFDTTGTANVENADPALVFAQTTTNGATTAGVLADNGGPVETVALNPSTSNPAIDVGTNTTGSTTDAIGNSRDVDAPGVDNGGTVDAGAVEVQLTPLITLPEAPVAAAGETDVAVSDDIQISDLENDDQTVTLTITGGTASVDVAGTDITDLAGDDSGSITFSGTLADVNTALDSLTFTPSGNALDPASIRIQTTDNDGSADQTLNFNLAEAGSLVVTTNLDVVDATDGLTSLREAINFANATANGGTADEITFDGTVFDGTGDTGLIRLTEGELVITEAVNITSGASQNILITGDANDDDAVETGTHITDVSASSFAQLDDNSRVLNITGSSSDVTLSNLTITGGRTIEAGVGGAGVRSQGALTLSNVTVSGNASDGTSSWGAGIRAFNTLVLNDSTVSGNEVSSGQGGGISAFNASITLNNSTVSDNYANNGSGGINATGSSSVSLNDSTVTDNETYGFGGGIYADSGTVTITGSTVSGNTAANGGGVYTGDNITLTNSTVSGNTASNIGGGLNSNGGSIYITGGTISGNTAANGGGLYGRSTVSLVNTTVSGNTASSNGGGIYLQSAGSVSLTNSIVLGNSANTPSASEISHGQYNTPNERVSADSHSIVGANSNAFDASGEANIDNADPADVFANTDSNGAGVLADNGGDVETIALNPSRDNPAIDRGTPQSGVTTDAIGNTRDVDQVQAGNEGANTVDLGAVEAQLGDLPNFAPEITLPPASIVSSAATNAAISDTIQITDAEANDQSVTLTITGGTANLATTTNLTGLTGNGSASISFSGTLADVNAALDSLTFTPAASVTEGSIQIQTDDGNGGTDDDTVTFQIRETLTVTTNLDSGDDATTASTLQDDVADGDGLSLREAIHHASDGIAINFDGSEFTGGAASLIRLTAGELSIIGKSLIIDGSTGTDIVITGDANGDDAIETGTLFITDVSASTTDQLDDNSRVFNITGSSSDVTFTELTITGGRTTGDGGGIRSDGDVTLTDSTVRGNSSQGGTSRGGGIYASGDVTLTNSTISDNTALNAGGGIRSGGLVWLTSSTVSGNQVSVGQFALQYGGGISAVENLLITNSTISGNSVPADGGGIHSFTGDVTVINSTISGNEAGSFGGGIRSGGDVSLTNSIVLGNNAPSDAEISGTVSSNTNSITSGDPTLVFASTTTIAGTSVQAGVLADNGGPVETIALNTAPNNPALDIGTAPTGVTTDATGNPRAVDIENVNNGGTVDAGAVEVQTEDGSAQDGFIAGALVFADADGDGVYDAGTESATTTDAAGNFTLPAGTTGQIILQGGINPLTNGQATDITTGLDFNGVLSAPAGSTVVTPLTTLINEIAGSGADAATIAAAETAVGNAFGLDPAIDLTTFDPLTTAITATGADAEAAAEVFAAGSQVLSTVVLASSVVEGASSDANLDAGGDAFGALATVISGAGGGAVDLTDTATVTTVVNDTASSADNTAVVDAAVVTAAADIITETNQAAQDSVADNTNTVLETLTEVTQSAIVAQGDAAETVEDASGGDAAALTEAQNDFTGAALATEIAGATVGTIEPDLNLTGTAGAETLSGAGGDDTLSGLAGSDTLTGGGGDDRFVIADNSSDIITDFDGANGDRIDLTATDTFSLQAAQSGADTVVTLGNGESLRLQNFTATDLQNSFFTFDTNAAPTASGASINQTGTGAITLTLANIGFADSDSDSLSSVTITDISGITSGTLALNGVAVTANQVISPSDISGGNLVFTPATNGSFSFNFTVSDGFVNSAAAAVNFTLNAPVVSTPSTPSPVVIQGNDDDTVAGSLSGGSTNDRLRGGGGDDTVTGGSGADTVIGGAGNDFVTGGTGDDFAFAGSGDMGDDTVQGNEGNDVIGGGAGNDIIVGGTFSTNASGSNVGNSGDDTLFGGAGDDLIIGGSYNSATNTVINNGQGLNTIWAGTGNDTLFGDDGEDTVGGGEGNDSLNAGGGSDRIFGGRGDGQDTIDGGAGDDNGFAGGGNDSLDGGEGNDTLFGGAGDDTVAGGAGADELWAGAGNDQLSGGAGADTFVFGSTSGNDTVTDFDASEDILNLQFASTDFTSLADVTAAATATTQNGQVGVLIDLGGSDSVFVVGISIADLTTTNVNF